MKKPVRNHYAVTLLLTTTLSAWAQPTITRHPTNLSVSVGASANFRVYASSTNLPITCQWQHAGVDLPEANAMVLSLKNVQLTNAGVYRVAVNDSQGTVWSDPATLEVDPTFTKITTGPIASARGNFLNGIWGDYDNDGDLDLFVGNMGANHRLFRNNGDGTFALVPSAEIGPILGGIFLAYGCSWVDYDNDGDLDLLITAFSGNKLYENLGNDRFQNTLAGKALPNTQLKYSMWGAWGDYDNDGWLDLFIATWFGGSVDHLFHNNAGVFERVTEGLVVTSGADSVSGTWADYDNDGNLELFVANHGGSGNFLYKYLGAGEFSSITEGPLVEPGWHSWAGAWADYDNDGNLDLFVANGYPSTEADNLFRNNGDGTFTAVEGSAVSLPETDTDAACWGDYDNDGFVDLFVRAWGAPNGLYHNRGDGTFEAITSGSPVNDVSGGVGATWADYDEDGFLDLLVTCGLFGDEVTSSDPIYLYRNNGNSNHWLKVKLVGTVSNRDGIGAKVRVKATYAGAPRWQLRAVSNAMADGTASRVPAHFGLGDATNVDLVRIEWPSGIVQEVRNVSANQALTIAEPARLETTGPGQFRIRSWKGMAFTVEASTDLKTWSPVSTVTNLTGTLTFADPTAGSLPHRFHRAVAK